MGKIFVKKAVVIAVVAFFLLLSVSATVSSKEFVLGALRLKMFLNGEVKSEEMTPAEVYLVKVVNNILQSKDDGELGELVNADVKKSGGALIEISGENSSRGLENGEMHAINGTLIVFNNSNDSMTAPSDIPNTNPIASGNMQKVNGSIVITPPSPNNRGSPANGGMQKANGSFVIVNGSDSNSASNRPGGGTPVANGNMQKINGSIIVTPPSPTTQGCVATGGQECIVPPPFHMRLQQIYQRIIQLWRGGVSLPTIGLDPYSTSKKAISKMLI